MTAQSPGTREQVIPVDGYHAAATDPDMTAEVVRAFVDKHPSHRN